MEDDLNRVETIEPFNQAGESRALIDVECERVEVELVPPDDESDDRVWLTVTADEECEHVARFTPDQAIRVGNWLVAAGEAALGD